MSGAAVLWDFDALDEQGLYPRDVCEARLRRLDELPGDHGLQVVYNGSGQNLESTSLFRHLAVNGNIAELSDRLLAHEDAPAVGMDMLLSDVVDKGVLWEALLPDDFSEVFLRYSTADLMLAQAIALALVKSKMPRALIAAKALASSKGKFPALDPFDDVYRVEAARMLCSSIGGDGALGPVLGGGDHGSGGAIGGGAAPLQRAAAGGAQVPVQAESFKGQYYVIPTSALPNTPGSVLRLPSGRLIGAGVKIYCIPMLSERFVPTMEKGGPGDNSLKAQRMAVFDRLLGDRFWRVMGNECDPQLTLKGLREGWERVEYLLHASASVVGEPAPEAVLWETWERKDEIMDMRVMKNDDVLWAAVTGAWGYLRPGAISIADFEASAATSGLRFATEASELGRMGRIVAQIEGLGLWLTVMSGTDFEAAVAGTVAWLRQRQGRLKTVNTSFLWYAYHVQVACFFNDLAERSVPAMFPSMSMSTPSLCASLLTAYLDSVDLSAERQAVFLQREQARVDYTSAPPKCPSAVGAGRGSGGGGGHKGKEADTKEAVRKVEKQKQVPQDLKADAPANKKARDKANKAARKAAVAAWEAPAPHAEGAGKGALVKAVSGYCLFHLGGRCGVVDKSGKGLMKCFSRKGATCTVGSHDEPDAAARLALAAALEGIMAAGTPALSFSPGATRHVIARLRDPRPLK
jgi:hypothetical protein